MNRNLVAALGLFLALFVSPLTIAQAPDLAGKWAGAMTTSVGAGGLEITLTRNGAAWKATARVRIEGREVTPPVEQLTISGADISFAVELDRNLVKFSGKADGDKLTGALEALQGERNDGYQITPNKQKFSAETLKGYDILVISNALGAQRMNAPDAGNPAFTEEESDAVRDWVKAGGALLLIADHAPMGAANQILGQRFGVDMSKMFTVDEQNFDKESENPGFIVYTRESGRLADHPITRGRNDAERVNKVIAFTGQSLKGPADSVAFMKLADTAVDLMPGPNNKPVSAAGRAQGIAMKFGKGRAVVLGEAAMLSAQLVGPNRMPFGMNRPGIDNRQLALNIVHWLSKLLK